MVFCDLKCENLQRQGILPSLLQSRCYVMAIFLYFCHKLNHFIMYFSRPWTFI